MASRGKRFTADDDVDVIKEDGTRTGSNHQVDGKVEVDLGILR